MRLALSSCALVVLYLSPADAVPLQQPGGAQIPSQMGCANNQPTGLAAELACECTSGGGCNIGPACPPPGPCVIPTGTCETTLYHQVNDNTCIPSVLEGLDPWQDGALTPETFTPTCPLTFEVVSRGTARFRNIFGWYNVTGARPTTAQLFPMIACDTAEGTEVVLDVRNDPRWTGGEIGFFLATPEAHGQSGTCAGGDCCARVERLDGGAGHVFYSQRALNPDAVGAESIIHLVVYDSRITERKFYFAWEDTLGAANNDFTDLVTSVVGVECAGGGQACDTGEPGMCRYGVTRCAAAAIECTQVYGPAPESCDGADNDCDGEVDEDASCEPGADCATVTCADGLICRFGQCMDPCIHVQCAAGLTCLSGVCVPGCNQCNGAVCAADRTCDLDTGACVGGTGPGGPDAGPSADGDGGSGDDGDPGVAAGCCSTGAPRTSTLLLALLALIALSRRRRS